MNRLRALVAGEDRGQSLVEVALMLPLLLLILLGAIDTSRVYASKTATANAAREAAIYAARDPQATADLICQRAVDELGSGTSSGTCSVGLVAGREVWSNALLNATVVCTRGGVDCGHDTAEPQLFQTVGEAGADVTVTVTARVTLISFYFAPFGLSPVPVSATATLRGLSQ